MAVFPAASVGPSSVHELFLPDFFALDHGLERRSAATHFALVSALVIVVMQPFIQIGLKRVDAIVELLAERDLIELLQNRLVEPFTDPVRLGRFDLGLGVVDVVDSQEELEIVLVDAPAIFRASVGHDPQHRQVMFLMERQHPIIEQISRRDRRLGGVELGMRDRAIGVHIGLLVDPPDALEGADIERVLAAQIARVGGFDLAAGLVSSFFFSRACTWASVRIVPSSATLASSAFRRVLKLARSWRSQIDRTPDGETKTPSLRSSFEMRAWP